MTSASMTEKKLCCSLSENGLCFHTVVDNLPGFAYSYKLYPDGKQKFLFASSNVFEIYGLDAITIQEDLARLRLSFHSEDLEAFEKNILLSAATMQPFHAIFRYFHPTKGLVWLETRSQPMKQEDGSVVWHGITLDITFQKSIELQLEDAFKFTEEIINTIPDLLFEIDREGNYLNAWSQSPFLQKTKKDLIGKNIKETLSSDAVHIAFLALEEVDKKGSSCGYTYSMDGKWFELSISKKESTSTYLALARDVTMRKETEKALLQTTTHLRAILHTIPDMVWLKDMEGRYLACNYAFEMLFGAKESDIIGKTDYHFVDKALADFFRKKDLETIGIKGLYTYEEEIVYKKTGENAILEVRKTPVFCEDGRCLGVLGTAKDITQKKALELLLQQKEIRLKEAQRIAKLGSWDLLFPELQFHLSDELYEILHLDRTEQILSFDHFLNLIHPEDRARFDKLVHESIQTNKPYDTLHRILVHDSSKYIYEHAETIYDNEGRPVKMVGIMQDITELKQAEHQIEFLAHYDTLTGLPNRSLAIHKIEQAIESSKDNRTKVALLHVDIDGFKAINDSLGYHMGDIVIQTLSKRLTENLKEIDTISRQGGDEFLIIVTDIEAIDDFSNTLVRLIKKLNEPIDAHSHSFAATVSMGIALFPDDGNTFETLLQKADTAMRKAKESGGNTYCFFTEEMNQEIFEYLCIQNDLKKALVQQQFVLYYQPQIHLECNTVGGAEALLRWNHPEKGLIPPMKFIPIAESSGLILDIGTWVIYEACHQAARWHQEGLNITIAVNISAVQFKHGNLEDVVIKALESSGLNPHFLELELTESLLIQDTENVFSTIKRLKSLGIKLSLDDFGTGYSSLSYLKRFAVDKLKIDRSFVRDILKDQEDNVIVKTIIQMAKSLNLRTIAEGVEKKEIVDVVQDYGCDEIQGFYFAKPMPNDEFVAYCAQMPACTCKNDV